MGRKAKPSAGRSLSADAKASSDAGSPAGCYRKKPAVDLEGPPESRHRILGAPDRVAEGRDQVAMALTPRGTDPPLPVRITSCRKGDGEHKHGPSRLSEKIMLHWNQPLYRFEIAAREEESGTPRRSASVPPPQRTSRSQSGGWSYLAAEGGEETEPPPWGRGLRRRPRLRESRDILECTNHEVLAERAARERAHRLTEDRQFADLCELTEQARTRGGADLGAIKERSYHKISTNMASILSWEG
mmetsp:Transcript_100906/g.314579  ORF Transcript_100906/g.314579 Transcript_100906/m.314579 type:complete len:244 (-) Transcript_100906:82-813(-)